MKQVPVIFLDRDGTINQEVNYLYKSEDLHLLPGVPEAIRTFRENGYLVIVITNQAGVARGYYTEEDVTALHQYLNEQLRKSGAWIDAFYYCPHHPEHGIGGYKQACACRKPGTGMFEQAERDFPVDIARSWMIGDKLIDGEAGHRYGLKSVLVGTGYGAKAYRQEAKKKNGGERSYEIYAETLMDAARIITGQSTTDHPEGGDDGSS